MQYGWFGKLPARRDFIAHHVPRAFLHRWEQWLETNLAESRAELGVKAWEETFRAAPIWRFWLGGDICGASILGAIMPSMDAVGRYFPLTFIAIAEGAAFAAPDVNPRHAWFEKIEDLLLSTLEPDSPLETLFEKAPDAVDQVDVVSEAAEAEPKYGRMQDGSRRLPLSELLADCRLAYQGHSDAELSFWWTAGGERFRPVGFMCKHLPEARLFTGMLTGDFDRCVENASVIGVKPL